ncbi:MAG TPA: energy transducer TonB [bacterium]|nr:energy transducer TonB [bacterium]
MRQTGGTGKRSGIDRIAAAALFLSFGAHLLAFAAPGVVHIIMKIKEAASIEAKESVIMPVMLLIPDIKASGEKSIVSKKDGPRESAPEPAAQPGLYASKPAEAHAVNAAAYESNEMLAYTDAVKRRIQLARRYPASARRAGIEGDVGLVFTITKEGALKEALVASGSGAAELDEEAVRTIHRASPFPKPPAQFEKSGLEMQVKIVFKLD